MIPFTIISHDKKSTTIRARSTLTGKEHDMVIPVDLEFFLSSCTQYDKGSLIQDAFPYLNAEQREFLLTGAGPGEYDELFPEEDE